MADDGVNVFRGNDLAGSCDHVGKQGLAAYLVKHLGMFDFRRVPLPAAIIAMATRGARSERVVCALGLEVVFAIQLNIPRGG